MKWRVLAVALAAVLVACGEANAPGADVQPEGESDPTAVDEAGEERSALGLMFELDQTTRDAAGVIIEAGLLGPLALQVGDCYMVPDSLDDVSAIEGVPCEQPHDAQVIAVDQALFDEYAEMPSEFDMNAVAEAYCVEQIELLVGAGETWGALCTYPTALSWDELDDRAGTCAYIWVDEDYNIVRSTETLVD